MLDWSQCPAVERVPGKGGGEWLFKATRVPVRALFENIEAGAIDRYGPAIGLPPAYSGHNNEWWWGPPQPSMGTTIFVGFDRPSSLRSAFGQITRAATFTESPRIM